MTKLRAVALATLIAMPALAEGPGGPVELGPLVIEQTYAIETPPGAPAGGGFMTIMNNGDTAQRLVAASREGGMTQIHRTESAGDGVMRMIEQADGVEIPAGETVVFERGGLHLMFMGLQDPLRAPDSLTVTLSFEPAGEIEVPFPILPRDAVPAGGHGMSHD